MSDPTISIIIPVYNEMRTVGSVVEVATLWEKPHDVIVVDDGSTDKTAEVLNQFRDRIRPISDSPNRGKGFALARGVEECSSDIVVFLDADVVGMTRSSLNILVAPVLGGQADMALGIVRFWRFPVLSVRKAVTGFRAIRRSYLSPHLDEMRRVGYGVEEFINNLIPKERVTTVDLPYLFIIDKLTKVEDLRTAARWYIRESSEIFRQVFKNFIGKKGKNDG